MIENERSTGTVPAQLSVLDRLHTLRPGFLPGIESVAMAAVLMIAEGPSWALLLWIACGLLLVWVGVQDGGPRMRLRDDDGRPLLVRSGQRAIRPWLRAVAGVVGGVALAAAALVPYQGPGPLVVAVCFGGSFCFLAVTGGGYRWVRPSPGAVGTRSSDD